MTQSNMEENEGGTTPSTLLLINCGLSVATVFLIKAVGDEYRVISRQQTPISGQKEEEYLTERILDAIKAIERATGHLLLTDEDEIIRNTLQLGRGADQVELSLSEGAPLSLVLIAPSVNDTAVGSADYLIKSFSSRLLRVITPDSVKSLREEIEFFGAERPNIVLFVGSDSRSQRIIDDMAELTRTIGFGIRQFSGPDRAEVIYAASDHWLPDIMAAMNNEVEVHQVSNLRPDAKRENIHHARLFLDELIQEIKLDKMPGVPQLSRWGNTVPTASLTNLLRFTRYQSEINSNPILVINWDQQGLSLLYGLDHFTDVVVRPELGLGPALANLDEHLDLEEINRWIPWETFTDSEAQTEYERGIPAIKNYLVHKSIHPDTLPMTELEESILQAVLLVALNEAIKEARVGWGLHNNDPIELSQLFVSGEQLLDTTSTEGIVWALLNGIQPVGVTELFFDPYMLLPVLGNLLQSAPEVAVRLPIRDTLREMGWIVGLSGRSSLFSRSAATLQGGSANTNGQQADSGSISHKIAWNSLSHVRVPVGEKVDLTLKTHWGARLGKGANGRHSFKDILGETHLIVDARTRPIALPTKEKERIALLTKWKEELREFLAAQSNEHHFSTPTN